MNLENKFSVIFFTYKRAILLDAAIDSLIKKSGSFIKYPIHVIYNYDNEHHKSYIKLKRKYKKKIILYKRKKIPIYKIIKFIICRPVNFLWILRYPSIVKNFTNFKFILEKILALKYSDFVMLNTDDTIFYEKVEITKEIFNKIREYKKDFFFRTNFGLGLKGLYKAKKNSYNYFTETKKSKNDYIFWNSKNPNLNFHMKYHFQVEGAIYHRSTLLNFLRSMIYHNPVTLEAIGYREARLRNFFTNTIAKINRSSVTCEINSVQTVTNLRYNYRLQINPTYMMKLYLKGFKLCNLISNKEKFNSKIIPKKIYAIEEYSKKNNKINILKLNKIL